MIFVTVGHQMPFDRLIRCVDTWVGQTGNADIFGQIGKADYKPKNFRYKDMLDLSEFRNMISKADLIVSHAGTGTILYALEAGKPILIMPRRAKFMETRNDHQVATAEWFSSFEGIDVAENESKLIDKLNNIDYLKNTSVISSYASPQLIQVIRNFILYN